MSKSVFVGVLDWGLGHATRCVPVIKELLNQNYRVVVGGSGPSLTFLKDEFKELTFYDLPSYEIVYPKNGSLVKSIIFQFPKILKSIRIENKVLDKVIKDEHIDFVVSDNRYGCFSKKVKSVFICHQANLQMPNSLSIFSGLVNRLHLERIKNFNEVWIPDEKAGFKYSGLLSNSSLLNTKHTGILSRFEIQANSAVEQFEIVALVSGPEPQRTIFENLLRDQLIRNKMKAILIKGRPGSTSKIQNGMITEADHLPSHELVSVLRGASLVISRSGYSTIMDLSALGKRVIFIPTPGQTEQEYLAKYFRTCGFAFFQAQKDFNLEEALVKVTSTSPLPMTKPNSLLKDVIQSL